MVRQSIIEELEALWQSLSLTVSDKIILKSWDRLIKKYREPHRVYHTDNHLYEMLQALKIANANIRFRDPVSVWLAMFCHDAVYNPRCKYNKEESAGYLRLLVEDLRLSDEVIYNGSRLVMTTKNHQILAGEYDAAAFSDADISILAACPERYDQYYSGIKIENAWLGDADYRTARANSLKFFLSKDNIFKTTHMQQYDSIARSNLQRELVALNNDEV